MRGFILSLVVFIGLAFNNKIFAQAHQSNKNDISERDKNGSTQDIWNLPDLPVHEGPYPSSWKGLSHIYSVPAWWREAKFGAWSHWDPQSMPEQGDWYARGMYIEGSSQYQYHVDNFGHPSEYGYKDICHNWVIDKWKPVELMDLYVEMGARYFMAMGVHHDNFDCYDSKYQPWNTENLGPKKDIVGILEKVAREHGMRFGIGFHNTPARTWGQFMTVRYTSDKKGQRQVCLTMHFKHFLMAKENGGKVWIRLIFMALFMVRKILCIHLLPTSLCGASMMPLPNIIQM